MITADQALERLQAGNRNYVSDRSGVSAQTTAAARGELVGGQAPFAVIFGCSDSRVPAELIFDQGLGDLFVIRVAGNIVTPAQTGTVEFAVEAFGTPLVLVMGHSFCGAVTATLAQREQPDESMSPNLKCIVDHISPAVDSLLAAHGDGLSGDALLNAAVQANVRATVDQLQRDSDLLRQAVADGKLKIVGAQYSLETGAVELLDDLE